MSDQQPSDPWCRTVIDRKIADLKPDPRNARTHSQRQLKQLADSIQRFGFTNPVLIDGEGHILAGHGRVAAARRLNWNKVPCLLVGTMSAEDKRAYILADNKLALNAGWDESLLASELAYLIEECPELDVALTGFSISEIDEILDLGGTDASSEAEEDDAVPALEVGRPAVTQTGDLWRLGAHRLICGDARDRDIYVRLLDGPAQMVFTDPPYNVPISGHVSSRGTRHREFAMASGEMSASEFTAFLTDVFGLMSDNSSDGSIHFVCMDWRHQSEILRAGEACYTDLKNLCVWVKGQGGMGTFYRSRHELIFVFKSGTGPHINSFELGQHGRYRTNVWSYPGVASGTKDARADHAMHPTVKPVAMVADAIKDCSKPGGVILDPFGGAGSTLIAAHKTRRHARLVEIDPHYCDTTILRWQRFGKADAIHDSSGKTFEELLLERREAGHV